MYIPEAAEAETVAVLRLRAAAKIFLSICSLSSFEKRKTQEAGGGGGLQFVILFFVVCGLDQHQH